MVAVTHPAGSLDEARRYLTESLWERLADPENPEDLRIVERVRFPVALLWVRGDRGGAGRLIAEQAAASYGYWNRESGKYFDIVFPGWRAHGSSNQTDVAFDVGDFIETKNEVEAATKWRYSGGTDLLLLHFEMSSESIDPDFAFDETIWLPVETLISDARVQSLDILMQELIGHAKDAWPPGEKSTIWEISDRLAYDRARRSVWEWVSKAFLRDVGKIYDDVRPFVVCDLTRHSPRSS